MSDASYVAAGGEPSGSSGSSRAGADDMHRPPPDGPRPPFPWTRLLYAIGFAIVAWVMFWLIVLLLAPLHFIVLAITGRPNEDLKDLSLRAVHYLVELLVFIAGAREEKPFPLGPIPKV